MWTHRRQAHRAQTRTRSEGVNGFGHDAVLPGLEPLHSLSLLRLGLQLAAALLRLLLLLVRLNNHHRENLSFRHFTERNEQI